jgi:hypothetical protein
VLFAAYIILSIKYFVTVMVVKALPGAQRSGNPNGIDPMSDIEFTTWVGRQSAQS